MALPSLESPTYGMQDPTAPQDYGSIILDSIETDELIFKKWQGASEERVRRFQLALSGLGLC